jgi:hypothetical protein
MFVMIFYLIKVSLQLGLIEDNLSIALYPELGSSKGPAIAGLPCRLVPCDLAIKKAFYGKSSSLLIMCAA